MGQKIRSAFRIRLGVLLLSCILSEVHGQANERILFTSYRDGNKEIYVMDADGGNQLRLTNSPAWDETPRWSPDGSQIVFASRDVGLDWEIFVMDADGKNVKNLTRWATYDRSPAWSPDGTRIAYQSFDSGSWDIFVMNADGGNRRRLTDHPAPDLSPSWSPDGKQITFISQFSQVSIIDVDGDNQINLIQDGWNESPSWSPDGKHIAYASFQDGNFEIYVVDTDGQNRRRLTHNDAWDSNPTWTQDSKQICFASERDGDVEIYLMNLNGSPQVNLSHHPAYDIEPSWFGSSIPLSASSGKWLTTWGQVKKK